MKLKGEKKNSLVRLLKERDNKVWVLLTTFFVKHIQKEIAKESYMEKRKNKRRRLEKSVERLNFLVRNKSNK